MTPERSLARPDAGTLLVGAALIVVAAIAWTAVVQQASSMPMTTPGTSPGVKDGVAFTLQWGVMMAAMMLPSALPMILLYRLVAKRGNVNDRAIPSVVFAGIYVLMWTLSGAVVYGLYVGTSAIAVRSPAFNTATPYMIAAMLAGAGVYQFTAAKQACLRYCESPLAFLMSRWRNGYRATFRIAVQHAAYCIGCCWALMLVLVAAGSMSISWVLAIAVIVFAEKTLPRGWQTARIVGVVLILLAAAITARPSLAERLGPPAHPMVMTH